jgi:hypothetical protein
MYPLHLSFCLQEQCLQATLFSSSDYADQVGGNKELTTVLMKMFAVSCIVDMSINCMVHPSNTTVCEV